MKNENKDLKNVCRICGEEHTPMNIFFIDYDSLNLILDDSIRKFFKRIFFTELITNKRIEMCSICYQSITENKNSDFESNIMIKLLSRI